MAAWQDVILLVLGAGVAFETAILPKIGDCRDGNL
jgi:hypothetical protein